MKSPIDNYDEEQARLEKLIGLADALKADPSTEGTYCVIGRHDVPAGTARTSPRGTSVCRSCAQTPRGKKELAEFDPTR